MLFFFNQSICYAFNSVTDNVRDGMAILIMWYLDTVPDPSCSSSFKSSFSKYCWAAVGAPNFCYVVGLQIHKALSHTVVAAQVKVMEKYCVSHLASSFWWVKYLQSANSAKDCPDCAGKVIRRGGAASGKLQILGELENSIAFHCWVLV